MSSSLKLSKWLP